MKKNFFILYCFIALNAVSTGQPRVYKSITWEKFKASGPALKQIGWLATRHARDIKSSPWSVGCETLDRDFAKFSVYKDYVGELGVKHARLQSGWAKCEKEKGMYNFAWLDSCVFGLHEQGVKPWICLCYGNSLYGSGINLGTGVAPLSNSETAMTAWLKYVETTVIRYKNVVNEWEIWNEPYGQEKEYTPLLIRTAELIKKVQSDAVILGEILTNPEAKGSKIMLDALKDAGKLSLVDFWAYHPYTMNPDNCYSQVSRLKFFLESYNPEYKIYQGENGTLSDFGLWGALSNYPWTEYSQAKWKLRRMAGDRLRNIPSSVFTIIDVRTAQRLASYGLIRSNLMLEFIYKKPSYYAVQNMAGFFDDSVIPVGEIEYTLNSPRKITIAGFKKEDTPVILVWFSDKVPGDDLIWNDVNITIKGVAFNDPVYVEMITGKVYDLDRPVLKNKKQDSFFKKLPVWDCPVMIAERSCVNMKGDKK